MKTLQSLFFGAFLLFAAQNTLAAMITIDDSDVDDVTFTWSGFDFFGIGEVGGVFSPLGGSGSATFADSTAGYEFEGGYFVADIIDPSFEFLLGADSVLTPGDITSFVGAAVEDGSAFFGPGIAFVAGEIAPYVAGNVYGPGFTSFIQGDTVTINGSNLTITFISEASDSVIGVPAPASLFLMGIALLGLGLRRKALI